MKIKLSTTDTVTPALHTLKKRVRGDKKLFKKIGTDLEASIQKRIARNKIAPDGQRWLPSKKYIKGRGRVSDLGSTLIQTGALRDSIHFYASATQVEIGTNMVYAGVHQMGTKNAGPNRNITIPARPYLGVSTIDENKISSALDGYFKRLLI